MTVTDHKTTKTRTVLPNAATKVQKILLSHHIVLHRNVMSNFWCHFDVGTMWCESSIFWTFIAALGRRNANSPPSTTVWWVLRQGQIQKN